jgi:hypothetical protein
MRNKKLSDTCKVVFVIAVFGFLITMWFLYSPSSSWAWNRKFPSKLVDAKEFSIKTPVGWMVTEVPEHDPNTKPKVLFFSRDLLGNDRKSWPDSELPYACLFFGPNQVERKFLKSVFGKFLTSVDAQRSELPVDGRKLICYRYSGSRLLVPLPEDKSHTIDLKGQTSISIGITSEFGFSCIFWGLQDHEKAFLKSVEAIKWKIQR